MAVELASQLMKADLKYLGSVLAHPTASRPSQINTNFIGRLKEAHQQSDKPQPDHHLPHLGPIHGLMSHILVSSRS